MGWNLLRIHLLWRPARGAAAADLRLHVLAGIRQGYPMDHTEWLSRVSRVRPRDNCERHAGELLAVRQLDVQSAFWVCVRGLSVARRPAMRGWHLLLAVQSNHGFRVCCLSGRGCVLHWQRPGPQLHSKMWRWAL